MRRFPERTGSTVAVALALLAVAGPGLATDPIEAAPQEEAADASERLGRELGGVTIGIGDNPARGASDAPITLIEFLDFECGFCARQLEEMMPRLEEEYFDAGTVRYVELDFPLTKIHRRAYAAARAGHCAARQGAYWELRGRMLEPGADLESWSEHVAALELDGALFEECLEAADSAKGVRADQLQGRRLRVPGTPTLVIARTDPADPRRVEGVRLIAGSKPWEDVKAEIDRALEEAVTDGSTPAEAMATDTASRTSE